MPGPTGLRTPARRQIRGRPTGEVPKRPPRSRTSVGRAANAPEEVAQRRARALEEPLDVRLRTASPYPLLEVHNPIHRTRYLVMLPEFPRQDSALCTCTDFARRGLGVCKHIEAGFRWLTDHPDAAPLRTTPSPVSGGPVWKAIDGRLLSAIKGGGPESVRWRRAGAVLFERDARRG